MKETDEENPEQKTKILTIAHTGVELYLINQQMMTECSSEYMKNVRLFRSLTFGISLLDSHDDLKKKVRDTLDHYRNISHKMSMNYYISQNAYHLGSDQTGDIYVRPEDLQIARDEMREQMSHLANKDLEILDYEVYCALMDEGVIRKKSIEEVMEGKLEQKFKKVLDDK